MHTCTLEALQLETEEEKAVDFSTRWLPARQPTLRMDLKPSKLLAPYETGTPDAAGGVFETQLSRTWVKVQKQKGENGEVSTASLRTSGDPTSGDPATPPGNAPNAERPEDFQCDGLTI
eukprot:COSAG05_NODE_988_length_6284_cov_7.662571_2_plen_119_part_00